MIVIFTVVLATKYKNGLDIGISKENVTYYGLFILERNNCPVLSDFFNGQS